MPEPDAHDLPADDSQPSESESDALVPVEIDPAEPAPEGTALADIRACAIGQPVEQMLVGLNEYKVRRVAFRDWLRNQLVEGLHFGYPPGCAPKANVPKEQWTFKPSLYKAGAEFVADLMGVRAAFTCTNNDGDFIVTCKLYSRATGELLGEGLGGRRTGSKSSKLDPVNVGVKMAEKCAKVDAILNTYGLSDMFTQDIEGDKPPPEKVDNPTQAAGSPKAEPRSGRVTLRELNILKSTWANKYPGLVTDEYKAPLDDAHKLANFSDWVRKLAGLIPEFDVNDPNAWPRDLYSTCVKDLGGTDV